MQEWSDYSSEGIRHPQFTSQERRGRADNWRKAAVNQKPAWPAGFPKSRSGDKPVPKLAHLAKQRQARAKTVRLQRSEAADLSEWHCGIYEW